MENGFIQYQNNLLLIFYKLIHKDEISKSYSLELNFKPKSLNAIKFDVIKRGPLLLLLIGLSIACLTFAIELIVFCSSHTNVHILNT